jgi:hypothetical protein
MNSFCAQRACCWLSSTNGSCFESASTTAITCSAIGTACTPRVLLTATLRAKSSGRQRVSTATAEVWIQRSFGACASSPAFKIQVYAASHSFRPSVRCSGVVA